MSTNAPTTNSNPNATDLETDLLTHLTTTPALEDLHSTLLSSLQRTGWTEKIRKLAQELLRAGRCERFDEVIEAVVASAEGRGHPSLVALSSTQDQSSKNGNGDTGFKVKEEDGAAGGNNSTDKNAYFESVDVRIPSSVVEQGVRAIKEVLREVVVMEGDDGDSGSGSASASGSAENNATEEKAPKDQQVKKVKTGESNGVAGSPVKKGEKKVKVKQGK
ncbi:uncharacterized protein BO97DRAFT_403858 [Aspergillus homomorphus CBS 101889]|uniref:Uncharacterized protein n=1 Tax=Aspergillus homomorphus (strain CBS 101889) TaxID=1450537 RepID=A0A395I4V1_ASPHC|nr:hypothetical protein BO97DRAFT_403858 [Aspergillus homomorphus CBS 101889]RAL14805.1 hypothetical protein BO97DRAFT_403858 [Aspergillus homomorphus CBS 101889]